MNRHILEKEEEVNFFKKLQWGFERFRGKLPFKCFSCDRLGHYVATYPCVKGKMSAEGNRNCYTHVDSDGLSNSDEDDQEIKLIMAYENDALEKEYFLN